MYEGIVVEEGPTADVIAEPLHPYTQALVAAVQNPLHNPEVDSAVAAPQAACPYIHRCPSAQPRCTERPELHPMGGGRAVRCVLYIPETRTRETSTLVEEREGTGGAAAV